MRLAADPGDRAPRVAIAGVHFAQRGGDDFDLGMLREDAIDHAEERAGVELGFGGDFGAGDAEAYLQIFLVTDEHVHMLDDAADDGDGALVAAGDVP